MYEDFIGKIIKTIFMNIFTFIVLFKIYNIKTRKISKVKLFIVITGIISVTYIYILLENNIDHMYLIIFMYLTQVGIIKLININNEQNIFIGLLISNAIVYVFLIVATTIEFIFQILFRPESKLLNMTMTLLIELILIICFIHIKKLKNGLSFLTNKSGDGYIELIMINASLVIMMIYVISTIGTPQIVKHIFAPSVIACIVMIILFQKTLNLYYMQRQLRKNLDEDAEIIKKKDEEIQRLSDEKFKISKLNHEFKHRQEALELKVNNLIANKNFNMEASSELDLINQINSLSNEYSENLQSIKNPDILPSTEITEIDDMFKYMQSECIKNKIDFKLHINGNVHHLVNKIIPINRLVTLIGDHLRDAIIAINSGNNKYRSIVAILGTKDKIYEFCVYDTGIEFEIDTLLKLGLEPVTTHKDNGGTGIGFITTFETLKATKASLIIEEKHEMRDNDYTKAVIIRFDGRNEYKIRSYRAKDILKVLKSNRIAIEPYADKIIKYSQ